MGTSPPQVKLEDRVSLLIALNTLLVDADDQSVLDATRSVAGTLLCARTISCTTSLQRLPATRRRLQGSSSTTDVQVSAERLRTAAAAETSPPITAEAFRAAVAAQSTLPAGGATLSGTTLDALSADVEVIDYDAATAVDTAAITSKLNDASAIAGDSNLAAALPNLTPASLQGGPVTAPPAQPYPPPSPSAPPVASPLPTQTGGNARLADDKDDDELVAVAIAVPLGLIALLLLCIAVPLCYWYNNPSKRPAFLRPASHYQSSMEIGNESSSGAGKSFIPTTPGPSMKSAGSPGGATPGAEVYDVQVEVVDQP